MQGKGKKYEPVEIDGVIYLNPVHASELLGISRNTMYKLLRTRPELSFEDAINLYLNKEGGKIASGNKVIYKGKTYSSVFEACLNLGLCYSTIYYRMREHKISFEEAIKFNRADYIKLDDNEDNDNNSETTFNLTRYCKEKNLDYRKMYRYVNVVGLSLKEAEDRILHNRFEVEYKGKTYKSLYDACIMLNIPYQRIYHRVKKGLTFEEAVNKDIESENNE